MRTSKPPSARGVEPLEDAHDRLGRLQPAQVERRQQLDQRQVPAAPEG